MFELRIEWQEAPGVRDPLLARTWARLEILVEGKPALQLLDKQSTSVRSGVYGSILPLATWIVESWWSLLYEPAPSASVLEGARAVFEKNPTRYQPWLRRHNLLTAREGHALPDMSIFRDEDRIYIRWVADPEREQQPRRFIGDGSKRLPPDTVHEGLATLIESVLERLSDNSEEEVDELRCNWDAVRSSERDEPYLCQALAAVGEDPYDPAGVDESLSELIETRVKPLAPALREDLLEASRRRTLQVNCERTLAFVDRLGPAGPGTWSRPAWVQAGTKKPLPHLGGYDRAARFRQELGLAPDEPIADLAALIGSCLGSFQSIPLAEDAPPGSRINGLVGKDAQGRPSLVADSTKGLDAERFLLARALHHWLFTLQDGCRRLLTHAHGWEQRSSRAFAAELLAPAAAIQRRLDEEPDIDESTLAAELQVSPLVIAHQMDNHGLR